LTEGDPHAHQHRRRRRPRRRLDAAGGDRRRGFLAGYCGGTRRSYATDLRLFSIWCHERNLTLFSVGRAHLELYGLWLEETGRMRSTLARRLSTLASFYKYCEQEQLVDRNPALNVRRPKVDYESRTLGLDRNELPRRRRPGAGETGST
jgi:hypothetical protein